MSKPPVETAAFWLAFILLETAIPMIVPSKFWAGIVMLFVALPLLGSAFGLVPSLSRALAWKYSLPAFILIGASLGACLWAVTQRFTNQGNAKIAKATNLSRVLYVGQIAVDTRHLVQDLYLRLTITGFNGSEEPVSIDGSLDGFVRYRQVVNDQAIDRGPLPVPSIDIAASNNPNPQPGSEFWIILDQRIPSTLATQMANSLAKGTVVLDLWSLNIWVTRHDSSDKRRLPIWDGVSCQERDGKIIVNKVVNPSLNIDARGGGIFVGPGQR